jgi:hypothetical protein
MNAVGFDLSELIGLIAAFLLTLSILSYILGDNFVFRTSVSIFIGVSAGLVVMAGFQNILWPRLFIPLMRNPAEATWFLFVPMLFGIFLFSFLVPQISAVGSLSLAFLVGIGAATVIGGAVYGTIIPLVGISLESFDQNVLLASSQNTETAWINSLLVLFGLITVLLSFQFSSLSRAEKKVGSIRNLVFLVGRFFIAVALGVIFFGVLIASQTALVERVNFLSDFIQYFLSPGG